jgi:oxygen-independent coproporphyrinogen-3 oxidase
VGHVRHLYVHLPFCAERCGYCDFVTVVGRGEAHAAYVNALLRELELERPALAAPLDTVFLGGGTPTLTSLVELVRLLHGLPRAGEVTVEANPETVTSELARALREAGVTRVSLGAQSFQTHLLDVLDRRADADDVRRAFHALCDAKFDNISLDLIYGIPGQSAADLRRDLEEAVGLGPDHLSWYELEAKPGTRFTHRWGAELLRQEEAMESYFECVVETLEAAGYRWYETANFCRDGKRAQHNLGYWQGSDYLGLGIGAVSTVDGRRWRNQPRLGPYLAALAAGRCPPRELEDLGPAIATRELLMLGLRLDEPVALAGIRGAIDARAAARLAQLGLLELTESSIALTRRGRFVGGGVTAELLADEPPARAPVASAPSGEVAATERL